MLVKSTNCELQKNNSRLSDQVSKLQRLLQQEKIKRFGVENQLLDLENIVKKSDQVFNIADIAKKWKGSGSSNSLIIKVNSKILIRNFII